MAEFVTVKPGDTLSHIAHRHGLSLAQLLDLNPGLKPNPDLIFPGQTIVISADNPPTHSDGGEQSTTTSLKTAVEQVRQIVKAAQLGDKAVGAMVVRCGQSAAKCLVKGIAGPQFATVGQQAEYTVTAYDFEGDKECCRARVKWRVELYADPALTLPIEIIPDCSALPAVFDIQPDRLIVISVPAGWFCFIRVYAYVEKPVVAVSQATEIKIQPILLAEADNGRNDDLAVGDYTDERFKPLYEAVYSNCVKFVDTANAIYRNSSKLGGLVPIHFWDHYNVKDYCGSYDSFIGQDNEQLFAMFLDLVTSLSWGDLETVGKDMIEKVKANQGGRYSHELLNEATKNAPSETRLLDQVKLLLSEALKDKKGNVTKVGLLGLEGFVGYLDKEARYYHLSYWTSRANGLGILLNGTAGYKIELTDYECQGNRHYKAQIKMTIYDHFGLDVDDITVTNPNEQRKHMKSPERAFKFLAWFYLQRVRGFKPLLTTIEHDYSIEGSY